jgi:hypothetical protein
VQVRVIAVCVVGAHRRHMSYGLVCGYGGRLGISWVRGLWHTGGAARLRQHGGTPSLSGLY